MTERRRLNVTASPALSVYADLTKEERGGPGLSRSLTNLIVCAALVLQADLPRLEEADEAVILHVLANIMVLGRENEGLPTPRYLAEEMEHALRQGEVSLDGCRPDLVDWVSRWPQSAVWALVEELADNPVRCAAAAPPPRRRGYQHPSATAGGEGDAG